MDIYQFVKPEVRTVTAQNTKSAIKRYYLETGANRVEMRGGACWNLSRSGNRLHITRDHSSVPNLQKGGYAIGAITVPNGYYSFVRMLLKNTYFEMKKRKEMVRKTIAEAYGVATNDVVIISISPPKAVYGKRSYGCYVDYTVFNVNFNTLISHTAYSLIHEKFEQWKEKGDDIEVVEYIDYTEDSTFLLTHYDLARMIKKDYRTMWPRTGESVYAYLPEYFDKMERSNKLPDKDLDKDLGDKSS
jgi:hypothetical protein